jgi:hypothetical protein
MLMLRWDGAGCKPSMGSHARSLEMDGARRDSSTCRRRCEHEGTV